MRGIKCLPGLEEGLVVTGIGVDKSGAIQLMDAEVNVLDGQEGFIEIVPDAKAAFRSVEVESAGLSDGLVDERKDGGATHQDSAYGYLPPGKGRFAFHRVASV